MGEKPSKPWDTFLFSNKTFPFVTTVHVNISSITSNDINRLLNFTSGCKTILNNKVSFVRFVFVLFFLYFTFLCK